MYHSVNSANFTLSKFPKNAMSFNLPGPVAGKHIQYFYYDFYCRMIWTKPREITHVNLTLGKRTAEEHETPPKDNKRFYMAKQFKRKEV